MKKNEIIAKVTTAVNTATIKVKKHSPETVSYTHLTLPTT